MTLLIDMILKGLSAKYDGFSTLITPKNNEVEFSDFKVSLRGFEESEKYRVKHSIEYNVMKMSADDKKFCYKMFQMC